MIGMSGHLPSSSPGTCSEYSPTSTTLICTVTMICAVAQNMVWSSPLTTLIHPHLANELPSSLDHWDTTYKCTQDIWMDLPLWMLSIQPMRKRTIIKQYKEDQLGLLMICLCKGNPLCFWLLPAFRFHFRSRSHHLISLPQHLWLNDILHHPLLTPFRSQSHDVARCRIMSQDSSSRPNISSNPPSVYDTLTRHVLYLTRIS